MPSPATHPEHNIHNNVIRSFLKSNMEYSLKKSSILCGRYSRWLLPGFFQIIRTPALQAISNRQAGQVFIHTCKTRGNGTCRFLASLVGEYPPQAPKHIRKTGWQRTFGAYTQDDYLSSCSGRFALGEASCGARYGRRFSRCVSSSRACSRASRYAA